MIQQKLNHIQMTLPAGHMKWSFTIKVFGFQICPTTGQILDNIQPTARAGQVKGVFCFTILAGVHIGPFLVD
eukprot:CAMPEP_0172441554 /NCGR_PEP_ID=MMETSP1065-20121228/2108_1 /TAXON_ID=265537 /ORGANISM="Amphiprora paludosa, Strain CCMP125" /LENGTH=71 /DNA_ID=CAMNT_0013191003 /DNA_START=47 /DNA_END=262 /DNA_ORIENTATION=+